MGVEISDNLISAKTVLLVEGLEDEIILKSFLKSSNMLEKNLKNGSLIIDNIGGCGNLSYQIKKYQNLLCTVITLLDNDESGRKAFQDADSKNLINLKNVFFTNYPGFANSEIEDLIKVSIYKKTIADEFGVILEGKKFKNNKKVWSNRVKDCFLENGKTWNDNIETNVKELVAKKIEEKGIESLLKQGELPINNLIVHLEKVMNK